MSRATVAASLAEGTDRRTLSSRAMTRPLRSVPPLMLLSASVLGGVLGPGVGTLLLLDLLFPFSTWSTVADRHVSNCSNVALVCE